MDDQAYIDKTKQWIKSFVIGLELCPFAAAPFNQEKIGFSVYNDIDEIQVAEKVLSQSKELASHEVIETHFVILPKCDPDFALYYGLVSRIQDIIDEYQDTGIVLVAFHPSFHYHGSDINDTANATNRSPYPMIHLLKKHSMDAAESSDVHIGDLLDRNQRVLSSMSWADIKQMFSTGSK